MADEPYLDNPAGRLHWTLQRFGSHRDSQIIAAWNSALNVEPARVPRALIGVADLIEDTKRAYTDSDLPSCVAVRRIDANRTFRDWETRGCNAARWPPAPAEATD